MKNRTYIIAEAGVNHNGSLERAIQLVRVAAESGADAVKFQTFRSAKLVSKNAPKADYQKKNTEREESQLAMLQKLEISPKDHRKLIECCKKQKIEFLSTPFDLESADFLIEDLKLPKIKISSGDLTYAPLLLHIARSGKPIILSTGMSTLGEVETALGVLALGYGSSKSPPSIAAFHAAFQDSESRKILRKKVTLLHCTTEYPAPFEDVNLRAIKTLRSAFGLRVGFSDHTPGISIPIAAVALGAEIIEKHFTLDRELPGPDHRSSLEPAELKQMITSIREVEQAMGNGVKTAQASEWKNRAIARRSLIAASPIHKGEVFTVDNLTVKRPGDGISPVQYWDFLGKKAREDYAADDCIGDSK